VAFTAGVGLLDVCKCIRDEEHEKGWVPLEQFVAQRTPAEFTHGICPDCAGDLRKTTFARAAEGA
jgi:hypothetical protein